MDERELMIVFSGGGGRPPDFMALVNIRSMMAHVLLSQARNAPKSNIAHASKPTFAEFESS